MPTENNPTLTTKMKDIANIVWLFAKSLIVIEIVVLLAFVFFFGKDVLDKFSPDNEKNSSVMLIKEDDKDCILQIIEGEVFKLCQE